MKKNLLLSAAVIALVVSSCAKKDDDDSSATNPCNFTTNVIEVEGSNKAIVKSDCKIFGTSYYSEHLTDSSATPEGAVMVFMGGAPPAAGDYAVINDITQLAATNVYVEYYKIADSFQPTAGSVKVTDSGGSKIYTFCNLSCSQGGLNAKKVSLRAMCN